MMDSGGSLRWKEGGKREEGRVINVVVVVVVFGFHVFFLFLFGLM